MEKQIDITFKEKKLDLFQWSLIYGFKGDKETYDVVFLLQRGFKYTTVHGLLSKLQLNLYYKKLWEFLKKNVKTKYIAFEVLESHYTSYKYFLDIEKEKDLTTFDGFKSKLIIVKKDKDVMFRKFNQRLKKKKKR